LRESGLTKSDIRFLSREMGLSTWNKPAFACLSSRFPYGSKITREKLSAIDKAEQLLLDLGFTQVRVRHHGDVARIELTEQEIPLFLDADIRTRVYEEYKVLGFPFTALDIRGYRTGSMNVGL
jgi:pyridinium-3,5-biscarboxylic acid mononucleotide sulfurtransferase